VKKQRDQHDERTIVERHDPVLGQTISARFRIVQKIAAGGFGAIYRAHDLARKGDVAVKVLHASLTADPNVIARFRREGATLSNLRAPHTVTTYEFGETSDGMLYIVMELLRGESLHERLRTRGALAWREALAIARAVCDSLAEAHALGIIHRDLKPANIHLEPRGAEPGFVKVLDFGIAKIRRGAGLDDGGDLTNAGQMIGTIDYMAPEQILGAACDGRTDIFTLGIVTYEMIAGHRPFEDSTTPTSMLAALLTQLPAPVSRWVPVPPAVDALIARCLRREAADRYATVQDFAAAIDTVLASEPGDDGATRQIELAPTTLTEPISFDDEATLFAPEPRRPRAVDTPASTLPPAPRTSHEPRLSPRDPTPPRARPPTPAPRVREATPPRDPTPPRARPPTPRVREATPPAPRPRVPTPPPRPRVPTPPSATPSAVAAAGPPPAAPPVPHPRVPAPPSATPSAGAAAGPPRAPPAEPAGWPHPAAYPPADARGAPHLPPVAPHFARAVGPGTPVPMRSPTSRTYDPGRDAVVGRAVWILALVVIAVLGIGIYTAIR